MAGKSRSKETAKRKPAGEYQASGFRINFVLLAVIALCAIYVFRMGIFEPEFGFGKGQETVVSYQEGSMTVKSLDAYADGNRVGLYASGAEFGSVSAYVKGGGSASGVGIGTNGQIEIFNLTINGMRICDVCNETKKEYEIRPAATGDVRVSFDFKSRKGENFQNLSKLAFFSSEVRDYLWPNVDLAISGGWAASKAGSIPSSFYLTDSPFHIRRVSELPTYFSIFEWPYSFYSFLSMLPPSILRTAVSFSPEYAYRVYSTLVFLLPIPLFYLFSRKTKQPDSVFLFTTIAYLLVSSNGLPTGSGVDLIVIGTLPHTLATFLSFYSFFFAYEYIYEKKPVSFFAALAFSFFSIIVNQRVLFAVPFFFAALCAPLIARGGARRAILLTATCAIAVVWVFAPPFLQKNPTVGGGVFEGVEMGQNWIETLVAFMQLGYIALPLAFAYGIWHAWKEKNMLYLALAAGGVMAYLFLLNPWVNEVARFVDGVRLMPSFFLPAIIVAGAGASLAYTRMTGLALSYAKDKKWDALTISGSFVLTLLVPAALVFFVVAQATIDQYATYGKLLNFPSEYESFEEIARMVGNDTLIYSGRSISSQYPIYYPIILQVVPAGYGKPADVESVMRTQGIRYFVLGDRGNRLVEDDFAKSNESEGKIWRLYQEYKEYPAFREIEYSGKFPLFELIGENGTKIVDAKNGASIENYTVLETGFVASVICNSSECEMVRANAEAGSDYGCKYTEDQDWLSAKSCSASIETDEKLHARGFPPGKIDITVLKKAPGYAMPLEISCLALVGICAWLSSRPFFIKDRG